MSYANPIWLEGRRKYWTRHDAHRFMTPAGLTEQKRAEEAEQAARRKASEIAEAAAQQALEAEVREMRTLVDHLKSYLTWRRAAQRSTSLWPQADHALERFNLAYARYFGEDKAGFNPSQPRVPKGDPKGGQWSEEGGGDAGKDSTERALVTEDAAMRRGGRREPGRIPRSVAEWLVPKVTTPEQERARVNRLADDAIKRVQTVEPTWEPRRSLYEPGIEGDIRKAKDLVLEAEGRLVELGLQSPQQLMRIYRAQHNSIDLLGDPTWPFKKDTVAVTIFDGVPIFGTNSTVAQLRTKQDDWAADVAREMAIAQYPDLRRENLGWGPLDGFYHAEPTVMFRAARANGGSLEGRALEIHVDREMCRTSCPTVLPIVGLQLGNPTVTFVDEVGTRRTMSDGRWK